MFWDQHNNISLISEHEAPGRLAKQLVLLARALAVARAEHEVSEGQAQAVTAATDGAPQARDEEIRTLLLTAQESLEAALRRLA